MIPPLGPRVVLSIAMIGTLLVAGARSSLAQSPTFAGCAQHTGNFSAPAQSLNAVVWSASVDLANSGAQAHYGAPLITPANTVVVPVKLASGFKVNAFDGATGNFKYTLSTDYLFPSMDSNSWFLVYEPVLVNSGSSQRLYYAGAGGTIYYIDNPDSDAPGAPVHQCFYGLGAYSTNTTGFNHTVFINTPITADTNGVVYFGFRVENTAPAPLNTTQSGFARIDPVGNSTYVLARNASGDSSIGRDCHNCAPALSNDGSTLYVVVKGPSTAYYCYLLGLDSTTLATKYSTILLDPRNGIVAGALDNGTASPMVAPDGDVFLGVFSNPNNGSRGFLLHFTADLQTEKAPSGFGWDYTPAIVPTNMVPGYTGSSSYLLFSKYNNYAEADGNGVNRIALLDPNATQIDPHKSANGLVEMREVMTVIGCTPDQEFFGATYHYAVREWCINAAAVNPVTQSVFAPSEDGHIYRWNLASNAITESFTLGPGLGAPYVPTVIGPDGTVYTINGGRLFALGNPGSLAITLLSSAPDLSRVVAGQPITFTASVSNVDSAGPVPSGTVTFQDLTYERLNRITNILAADVPLDNGLAAVTNSTLEAGSNCLGNHFIIANYSGDSTFSPAQAMLVQKVHAYPSSIALSSAANGSGPGVSFTVNVSCPFSGSGTPSGMISFWDGATFLAQMPLDTNGNAVFTSSGLSGSSHNVTARYSSDTMVAASTGYLVATPPQLTGLTILSNGAFQFSFTNTIAAPFTVLSSGDMGLPLRDWTVLGPAAEVMPGRFQFADLPPTNSAPRFYRVREGVSQ